MKWTQTFRAAVHSRAFKHGGYATILSALMLVFIVALNLFTGALPSTYTKFDLTDTSLFSLSDASKQLAKSLTQDVTLYYLVQTGGEDMAVANLLEQYKAQSSHVNVVQKDPVLYPTFGVAYDAADVQIGSIIVECGTRYRVIPRSELYQQTPNYTTYTYDTSFAGESTITAALSFVTSETTPKLYTLEGHGEASLNATLQTAIADQNIEMLTLSLLTQETVPADAGAVLLNAPTKDLSAEEAQKLQTYLAEGGRLLLLTNYTDYNTDAMPNLSGLLSAYGMSAGQGIVIETNQNNYLSGYPYYLLPNVETHAITQPLADAGSFVVTPLAHAINVLATMPENVTVTPLLTTTDSAYNKRDAQENASITQTAEDETGLFNVAAAAENSETNARIVWFSTGALVDEMMDSVVSGGNSDLFLNGVNWLTDNDTGISLHPKQLTTQYLTVPQTAGTFWCNLLMFVLPAMMLIAGFLIWMKRRKR